ncbi:MAG: hypothetical protein L6R39_006663 [Caloplaca ligustica]|nr:MAG: hypothetical protein L6R39_006663 [Caloplaca ligustica]
MRSSALSRPIFLWFMLSLNLFTATARLLASSSFSLSSNVIPISNPVEPLSDLRMTKRMYAGSLPGGWRYAWDEVLSFNHIPSAAKYLEEFYRAVVEELDDDEDVADVLESTVALSNPTFQLVFSMRDQQLGVPLALLKSFLIRMLLRTELGWVTKYRGWIQGPGEVVVDVALHFVGPITASILDSAMDMYGY